MPDKMDCLSARCSCCGALARIDLEPTRAVVVCAECGLALTMAGEVVRVPDAEGLKDRPWMSKVFSIPKKLNQKGEVSVFHGHSDDRDA